MKYNFGLIVFALILSGCFGGGDPIQHRQASGQEVGKSREVVKSAESFLASLSPNQRHLVQLSFRPEPAAKAASFKGGMNGQMDFIGEKYGDAVWSNYPVSDVIRPGLQLGKLTTDQRDRAFRLLAVTLSDKGFRKINSIMDSDQALADEGQHYAAGRDVYTICIFGTPSTTAPWMIQFGGHHLGLNIVISGDHGVMTPTLTGTQPASFKSHGKTVRVLAEENDKAFELLNKLDSRQRKQAVLNYEVNDLVLGPGHSGEVIQPEGLKGSSMNPQQKETLLDVISEWAGIINETYATERISQLRADLDETYFAWSGPTTHKDGENGTAYYRIQGPHIVIEFSPQGTGGDKRLHVHTVYRDPTDDYGTRSTLNANR